LPKSKIPKSPRTRKILTDAGIDPDGEGLDNITTPAKAGKHVAQHQAEVDQAESGETPEGATGLDEFEEKHLQAWLDRAVGESGTYREDERNRVEAGMRRQLAEEPGSSPVVDWPTVRQRAESNNFMPEIEDSAEPEAELPGFGDEIVDPEPEATPEPESTSAVQQLTERQKKEPKLGQQRLGLPKPTAAERGAAQPIRSPEQARRDEAGVEDTPERQPEGEQRSFEDYEAEQAAAAPAVAEEPDVDDSIKDPPIAAPKESVFKHKGEPISQEMEDALTKYTNARRAMGTNENRRGSSIYSRWEDDMVIARQHLSSMGVDDIQDITDPQGKPMEIKDKFSSGGSQDKREGLRAKNPIFSSGYDHLRDKFITTPPYLRGKKVKEQTTEEVKPTEEEAAAEEENIFDRATEEEEEYDPKADYESAKREGDPPYEQYNAHGEASGEHDFATGAGWGGVEPDYDHFSPEGEQQGQQGYAHEVQDYARTHHTEDTPLIGGPTGNEPHDDVYEHYGFEGGHMGENPITLDHLKDYIKEKTGEDAPTADWEGAGEDPPKPAPKERTPKEGQQKLGLRRRKGEETQPQPVPGARTLGEEEDAGEEEEPDTTVPEGQLSFDDLKDEEEEKPPEVSVDEDTSNFLASSEGVRQQMEIRMAHKGAADELQTKQAEAGFTFEDHDELIGRHSDFSRETASMQNKYMELQQHLKNTDATSVPKDMWDGVFGEEGHFALNKDEDGKVSLGQHPRHADTLTKLHEDTDKVIKTGTIESKKQFLREQGHTNEYLNDLSDDGIEKEFKNTHKKISDKAVDDKRKGIPDKEEVIQDMADDAGRGEDEDYKEILRKDHKYTSVQELVKKYKDDKQRKEDSVFEHKRNDANSSALNMDQLPEEGTDKLHAMDRLRDIAKQLNANTMSVEKGGKPLLDSNSMSHLKELLLDAMKKGDLTQEEFSGIAKEALEKGEDYLNEDHKASIDADNEIKRAHHEEFLDHAEGMSEEALKEKGHNLDQTKAHELHEYDITEDGKVGERTGSSHHYREEDGSVGHREGAGSPESADDAVEGMEAQYAPKLLGLDEDGKADQEKHFDLMKKALSSFRCLSSLYVLTNS